VGETRVVDGRDLPAPEPLERVLAALTGLGREDRVRLLIHREPLPLYELLRERGYRWETRALGPGDYEVLIWSDT